jgi:hypothetical protein
MMRKISLDVESLNVESFATTAMVDGRGTVEAHGPTGYTAFCQCQYATNYGTCQGTCVNTCGGPTCEDPCATGDDTCYLTCGAGCGWTNGDVVCRETP